MKRLRSVAAVVARKLGSAVVIFAMAAVLAAGMTYAATIWRNTDWIEDGQPITAQKMRDNFEYLYWRMKNPFPCSPNAENMVRMGSNSTLEVCTDMEWVSAGSLGGTDSCGSLADGAVRVSDAGTMEYCSASEWIATGIEVETTGTTTESCEASETDAVHIIGEDKQMAFCDGSEWVEIGVEL